MSIKKIGMKSMGQELPSKDIQLSHTRNKWAKRLPRKPPKKNVPNQAVRAKQRLWNEVLQEAMERGE